MYLALPYRFNDNNRMLFNKIYQVRGAKWRSQVLDGTAFNSRNLEDGFNWVPEFAKSVVYLMTEEQMPALEKAIDLAVNSSDRAFLICACIDAETLHKSGRVQPEHLEELESWLLSCNHLTPEFATRTRQGVKGFLAHQMPESLRRVIDHVVTVSCNASVKEQSTGIDLLESIYRMAAKNGALTSELMPLHRFDFCVCLAFIRTSRGNNDLEGDQLFQDFQVRLSDEERVAVRKLQQRAISKEFDPLLTSIVLSALKDRVHSIDDGRLFKSLLDGTTLCGVPYYIARYWELDPDDLLDSVNRDPVPFAEHGAARLLEVLELPELEEETIVSATHLFKIIFGQYRHLIANS